MPENTRNELNLLHEVNDLKSNANICTYIGNGNTCIVNVLTEIQHV